MSILYISFSNIKYGPHSYNVLKLPFYLILTSHFSLQVGDHAFIGTGMSRLGMFLRGICWLPYIQLRDPPLPSKSTSIARAGKASKRAEYDFLPKESQMSEELVTKRGSDGAVICDCLVRAMIEMHYYTRIHSSLAHHTQMA